MRLLSRIVCLSLILASSASAQPVQRTVSRWQAQTEESSKLLKAGEYAKARKIALRLTGEMCDLLGPGEVADEAFALVLVHRALAEAGLGAEDEALWYWHVALGIAPQLAQGDLGPFGEAGELLRRHPLPPPGSAPQTVEECGGDGEACAEVEPPRVKKRPRPKFPDGARFFRVEGTLVVQVVIGKDGRVSAPRVLHPLPAPTLTFTALEALKQWRFEPARLGGEPVAVYYNLSVNYDLR